MPQLQMKGLEVLEWATDNDILVIGVGHDPMVIPSLITKLKNSTGVVKKFNFLPPIPVVQPRPKCNKTGCSLQEYVEYVLIGYGSQHKPRVPTYLLVRKAYPVTRLRPHYCPMCVKPGQPSGITADGCDTATCEVHTWARGRFTSRLPGNPPRKQREVKVKNDIDDLMGTIDNASDDSDDGSGEEPEGNEVDEVEEEEEEEEDGEGGIPKGIPAPTESGRYWLPGWRGGWAVETWTKLLESLAPRVVVLCGSVHLQPGLLYSVLSYNDTRFGLGVCELIGFYPRGCASHDVDVRARATHLEQGHIADHMLERVSSYYAALRLLQRQTAQRNNLGSNTSTEDEKIGWPLVKRKMPWQPLHPAPKQLMAKLHQLLVGVLEVWVMGWGAAFQPASSSLFLATLALRAP